MIKIDIISGFLGAGKTTFIKKMLTEAVAGEKVVLIENEFGEIGIDGGFLKDAGIEIREMNSGCICCSLVGDFGRSLEEVLTKYQPERVIIEPSGVGKLSDVITAVLDVSKNLDVELNSAVAIVDASKCKMYMKNFGEFFNDQIESAKTIVLSRTDIVSEEKTAQAIAMIREHNKEAVIVTTPIVQLEGQQLLKQIEKPDQMMKHLIAEVQADHQHHDHDGACGCGGDDHDHGEGCGCGGHHHDHGEGCGCGGHHHDHDEECGCGGHRHHAEEVFASWGTEQAAACSQEELKTVLEELAYGNQYGDVLRAKGMVPSNNAAEWLYFDLVPEQYEIRISLPDYAGKVCVIGADLDIEKLKQTFERKQE